MGLTSDFAGAPGTMESMFRGTRGIVGWVLVAAALTAEAKDKGGSGLGVILSTDYQAPAPATMGFNLGLDFSRFARLTGGFGASLQTNENVAPLYIKSLFTSMAYIFLLGQVKWMSIYNFFSGDDDTLSMLGTAGARFELFVPGWKVSPTIGIAAASYDVTPEGFHDLTSGSHVYYTAGLDLLSDGLNVRAGLNYSPQLPAKWKYGFYAGIGVAAW